MITSAKAEESVDWLGNNARKIAQARAERAYVEAYLKTKRAELMKEHANLPVSAQEREAYAHPSYLATLQAFKEAVEADEYLRFSAAAHEARIEAWRSQESTRRAEGKAFG